MARLMARTAQWRVARALERLRDQVDQRFPDRNKRSDGTIGDQAHRSRTSDHNAWVKAPDGMGVVSALDLTHSPGNGPDTHAMAEWLRLQADPRIKYVISNRRIFSSSTSAWTWRKYSGSNPHIAHMHISVRSERAYYDDASDWNLFGDSGVAAGPVPVDADSPERRPVLRLGSRGEDVRHVQRILQLDLIDGIFGPETDRVVRLFQKHEKLVVDGIIGIQTWTKLDTIETVVMPLNYMPPQPLSEPE